ncbi:MAG: hypothetical protein FJZ63_05365 [Chlamydiae bacterium]|nr:hypothetical protein [Chlamydiota bacterium]
MTKTLKEKLQMKEGQSIFVLNPPEGYLGLLGIDPSQDNIDVLQVFIETFAELKEAFSLYLPRLKAKGIVWVSYPKLSSLKKVEGLHRDTLADFVKGFGWQPVAICAVDDTWSALRLKKL